MGCFIVVIIFALCIAAGGIFLGPLGIVLGILLALFLTAKLNSRR